jgi:energy-coupling factor transporter ATP-binding protein EcfA2
LSATLVELRVRNLGVVDDVTIAVPAGMIALTGETGAGKTLLVEALGLLLGGRADPSVVRAGADEAFVEGRFLLAGNRRRPDRTDRPEGDQAEIVLARAVVRGGRSRAWIDGRMASVGALAEVAEGLVELHGQHQHRSLVHPEAQRQALDHYAGIDCGPLDAARLRLRRLIDEREALGGDARQRAHQRDLLDFQIAEIEDAHIEDVDEEARLEAEEERLADVAAHREAAALALTALSEAEEGSALDRLAEAARALGGRAPLSDLDVRVRSAHGGALRRGHRPCGPSSRPGTTTRNAWTPCGRRRQLRRPPAQVRGRSGRGPVRPQRPRPPRAPRRRRARRRPGAREIEAGAGRRPSMRSQPRWPHSSSPDGRRPAWPPPSRTLHRPGHGSGPVRGHRRRVRAGRPGDLLLGANAGEGCARWPRRPPAGSWPAPCWPCVLV